ncbi:MAG TPA: FAD-dependent oxidoreductase [Steroidobacteraceae bacterium]|nr:FAD-dependent oxidoreductase [Steroidobacteraceae bacterium]
MSGAAAITRDTLRADGGRFDVVVVGGGIQGILCALESAQRGLGTLLVDAGDYGAGTSFNSLRTVHGGLRYLQWLDFARARQSNAEQQWWFRHFPDLVERRACLMPLDGGGLRGRTAFRVAGLLARLSGMKHPAGHRTASPAVELLTAEEVLRRLPDFPPRKLRGAALWHEGFMPESSRLVIECLRWAVSAGVTALNYVELLAAQPEHRGCVRLELSDRVSGAVLSVVAGAVVNAGGAHAEEVGRRLGGRTKSLLVPTLAWNLFLDAELPDAACIVLTPPRRGAQTYFVQPFHGRVLAGTGHAPIHDPRRDIAVAPALIDHMRRDLDAAWPRARLGTARVLRVLAGVLPGVRPGHSRLALRPRIVRDSGPGDVALVHVVGVKFTESPHVARRAIDQIAPSVKARRTARPAAGQGWNLAGGRDPATRESLLDLATSESVVYLDDLIERRTNAWCAEPATAAITRLVGESFPRKARERD